MVDCLFLRALGAVPETELGHVDIALDMLIKNPTIQPMTELNPIIASSTDSTKVANTIKGVLLSASGVIVYLLTTLFHITLSPSDMTSWVEAISMVGGGVWAIYGLLHKGVATLGRVR